ncbi:MAG: type II toxin-antitoxin system VapC family toxin [Chloroflexi bacterium]|nr:type II toxin-antitoxin system VapC family toxin [Chloroflexota bacterium]
MIVVDTNIIAYFFITSTETDKARQVMKKDSDWLVPPLWQSEFRNALVQYVHHKIITLDDAQYIFREAEELLEGQMFPVYSDHVLSLADQSSCSAYDCEFVSLAKDFGVFLVTADKRILRDFPKTAVSPQQFLERGR